MTQSKENVMKIARIGLICCLVSTVVIAAVPVVDVESRVVKTAQRTYNREVQKVDEWYAEALVELKEERLVKLAEVQETFIEIIDEAYDKAIENEELDEALRLRDLKAAVAVGEEIVTLTKDAVEFNGHSYVLSNKAATWEDAAEACAELGGYLVQIQSEEELEFVRELLTGEGTVEAYWIDGALVNEVWRFADGTAMSLFYWATGQPDNYKGKSDVISMLRVNGAWYDRLRTMKYGVVCELNVASEDD